MTAMRRTLTGAIAVAAALFFLGATPAYTDQTPRERGAKEVNCDAPCVDSFEIIDGAVTELDLGFDTATQVELEAETAAREAADDRLQSQIDVIEGIGDIADCVAGDILVFNGSAFDCVAFAPFTAIRTVFTTSTKFTGDLMAAGVGVDGLDGADSLCQDAADAGIVPEGEYVAFLSTSTVDARDRLSPNYGGYVLPDGTTMIAASKSDLLDGDALAHPINRDEFGEPVPVSQGAESVWTGSFWDGTSYDSGGTHCDEWAGDLPESGVEITGHDPFVENPFEWIWGSFWACSTTRRLYCFQR
jgi:hypothetical protein